MNEKMTKLRGRRVTTTEVRANQESQQELIAAHERKINQTYQLILALSGKVFTLENMVAFSKSIAQAADWRSAACAKIWDRRVQGTNPPTEAEINALAEELQLEFFTRQSDAEDQKLGLVRHDGPAADGHYAILTMGFFKDGVEIADQRLARSKIEIGKNELMPEMDGILRGLRPGEKKVIPFNVRDLTDTVEVTLLSLRAKATSNPVVPDAPQA